MEQVGLVALRVLADAQRKMEKTGDAWGRRRKVAITDRLGDNGANHDATCIGEPCCQSSAGAWMPMRASDCA